MRYTRKRKTSQIHTWASSPQNLSLE